MIEAPIPYDEAERQAALDAYKILDTAPESGFDDLTALAAAICGAPISLVSLIDGNRQVFKSHHGLDATETPRQFAFCAHAILQEGLFVVPDAARDPRFHDNPLVTEAPHVRSYAGTPLINPDGYPLGTLCVIDHVPRELTTAQLESLTRLGRQVVAQLELRRSRDQALQALRDSIAKSEALDRANEELRSITHIVSHDLRAPLINLTGFSNELRTSVDAVLQEFADTQLTTRHPGLVDTLHRRIPAAMQFIENAAMRMNGQLDIILELSRLGRYELQPTRVNVEHLVRSVVEAHVNPSEHVHIRIALGELPEVNIDPGALAIILNNLVSNALKYHDGDRSAKIDISGVCKDREITLCVADNGRGIASEDRAEIFKLFKRCGRTTSRGEGVGLTYCRTLVNRLGGRIWLESEVGKGSAFFVSFPGVTCGTAGTGQGDAKTA